MQGNKTRNIQNFKYTLLWAVLVAVVVAVVSSDYTQFSLFVAFIMGFNAADCS